MTTPRQPGDPRGRWDSDAPTGRIPRRDEHPGLANYPDPREPRDRRYPPPHRPQSGTPHDARDASANDVNANRYLPPRNAPRNPNRDEPPHGGDTRAHPRKITVTRVAAMRSRELTAKGIASFHRAAKADGAEKSGLTALTYAVMANFATDAAMAVALANTLFFAAAKGESQGKVALYLIITIAPFAVIAPLIGPLLDRLQHGRRIALAASFALRTVLAIILISNFDGASGSFDGWVLYPCALGMMVLSKSFGVLKAAVTPRVLPPEIDLVRVNSRLTVFGLVGGTIGAGAVASGIEFGLGKLLHQPGALWFIVAITALGIYLSMRIPSWVEVTEGEVPAKLRYHDADTASSSPFTSSRTGAPRQPLGRTILVGLWGNGTIRVLTGFLTLFIAFVAKEHDADGIVQLAMIGLIGAAAGIGNFVGNAAGARIRLGKPDRLVLNATAAVTAVTIIAAITGNIMLAALTALVASAASAVAKVCLDASLQDDLPEESRASAFGRSETVLQLSWVIGGALGVLLPKQLWIGFTVIAVILAIGLAQTFFTYRGRSLVPGFGGNRPTAPHQPHAAQTFSDDQSRPTPGQPGEAHP